MMARRPTSASWRDAGLLAADGEAAAANDLILAVARGSARSRRSRARRRRRRARQAAHRRARAPARTVRAPCAPRCASQPAATLALISVPGDYAAGEARKALRSGLDVMIFSDNVPLEEEVALKREAQGAGPAGDGPRLRHRHHRRHAARLRQPRAARRHRRHRRVRHRHAGSHLPDRAGRQGHLAGDRRRRPRSRAARSARSRRWPPSTCSTPTRRRGTSC